MTLFYSRHLQFCLLGLAMNSCKTSRKGHSMSVESEKQRERRKLLDRIDREILRDLLSIATVQITIESGEKHSRSEALREVLLKYFEKKPDIRKLILSIDEKRNLRSI